MVTRTADTPHVMHQSAQKVNDEAGHVICHYVHGLWAPPNLARSISMMNPCFCNHVIGRRHINRMNYHDSKGGRVSIQQMPANTRSSSRSQSTFEPGRLCVHEGQTFPKRPI